MVPQECDSHSFWRYWFLAVIDSAVATFVLRALLYHHPIRNAVVVRGYNLFQQIIGYNFSHTYVEELFEVLLGQRETGLRWLAGSSSNQFGHTCPEEADRVTWVVIQAGHEYRVRVGGEPKLSSVVDLE